MRGDGGSGQRVSDSVSGCVFVHVRVVWMCYRQSSIWSFLVVCLFIYLTRFACFDTTPQGHASRFLYFEAQSLYIHYATLLPADICLWIKTKGASFFFLFFQRQHTHAWLRRQDCWLCIGPYFPFSFCKVAHIYMCMFSSLFFRSISPWVHFLCFRKKKWKHVLIQPFEGLQCDMLSFQSILPSIKLSLHISLN